jgi:hypothetical protein
MVNVALETMKADGRLEALYKTWIEPKTGKVPEVPFWDPDEGGSSGQDPA